ncbi:H-NS family nucleoid-associated regulatory protein [Actinobacillus porcinus]|uniref:DNA-binding protein n=1 Tax=Actinobacillus porcinus TaxID=51048 RepID=A0ABY6TLX1_9PAST|nr:H-NS family nucleoid-associated regulatory protein [Actinobacillus porcinus]MCI5763859.1 H-NS histone family protein [Actinobacillus porcinus]MDY5422585.1 H-NS family nucleoid-associated regulatory protein [Actinobacillus porcinus]MDY6215751.1 H-NS family nucleoid-associated regulatory protein [Actinobacillus porcinus]VFY93451.1 histone family protein nucleoid-structuring protein H-NS [Actinobacillus porcinus]VTU08587.1 histone family protein nucleoid-structuring protein H-NS [Actinobacillu
MSLAKNLNNLRSLRAAVNELGLELAEQALEKLQQAIAEKREADAAAIAEEKARQELIAKYKEELKANGISLTDLGAETAAKVRKPRQPLAPKYKYTDENGETKTWTGQGRTPRAIQAALNAGKSLDSFAI